ncbi:uncharacterized protein MELLADRAFT_94641 [Melampsora larici-populina 98AG31]|uniref:Tet-like 2OG-Fe(II) oxygenase domain-containing protein n=1 Tax=Melampsora larici-populina (strain 98AG31 / pathotype 3-4-7) TaxID=747676 RepID=F4S7F5_MELLP|nr:uncharacterized protein MELLADRAFT_94641 [Melampsora larici-populina 98AG31]EGF99399.1 hypothetical protein MELLADRAFT_94641 [Melampsora larici-populina 98AG31]
MTDLDPGWTKHKRATFNTSGKKSKSEDENITLPGVQFLSDLLKDIDVQRQTGYTDADLPKPFRMAKSYSHVPHEYLAPDGFPKSEYWLDPACKYALVSKVNPKEGKGGVVRRALDEYRNQHVVDVPPNPPLYMEKIRQKPGTCHAERAKKNIAAKGTDQSAESANRKKKTYDSLRYRVNDPILPYENYERTMEIIHHTYKIITHGKGQYLDLDSHELIFTYSYDALETLTPEDRQEHQDDVTTILMSTKLFKRLPTPKPLTPPTELPTYHFRNVYHGPFDYPIALQIRFAIVTAYITSSVRCRRKRKGQPLSTRNCDSKNKKVKLINQEVMIGESGLFLKKRKRKVTTNAALIHGRMHCFGQTVGYSNDLLTSAYVPPKGSSHSLYKAFLDRLPVLGAHIGGIFKEFCDEGFLVARQQLNQLRAPPMASTSKSHPSGPLDFVANFAFTFENFYNKPHTDNNKGKVYCLWYPIDMLSGRIVTQSEGFELEGGWFIFPEFRVAINFGGKSAAQIAWNGKSTFHHTIPSKERIEFNHQDSTSQCEDWNGGTV